MPAADEPFAHPFRAILGLLIAGFAGLFSEAALNVALPDFMTLFRVTASSVQWLTTGYLLIVGVLLPLSGLLVRWFTTRQLLFTALGCFVAGSLISGLAGSFAVLVAGRVVQGIATGILIPLIFSTAIAVFPAARRGRAMGVIGLVIMFAPAISPTVAGVVIEVATWRWIFWLMIVVVLIAAAVSLLFLRNVRETTRPPIDTLSIVLSTIGFGLIVFGVSSAGGNGWGSPLVYGSLIVGLAALAAFARRQLRLEEPILDVRALTRGGFAAATGIIFLTSALMLCAIFLVPMYLEQGLGKSALVAGLTMLPSGVVNGGVSVWAGHAADVHRPQILVRAGFCIVIVGLGLLLTLGAHTPLAVLIVSLSVLMVGIPLVMTPTQTAGLNALPSRLGADGSAILSTLQQIGGAVGTAFGASLLSLGRKLTTSGAAHGLAGTVSGVRYGFICSLAFAVLGLCLALFHRGWSASLSTTG